MNSESNGGSWLGGLLDMNIFKRVFNSRNEDEEESDQSATPPVKRRRLTKLVENQDGNRSQALNDDAVTVNDAENVTVKLEPIEDYEIDTDCAVSVASLASTVSVSRFGLFSDEQSFDVEMEPIEDSDLENENEEPKIYLDLLDDKTLTKIFDNLDLFGLLQVCEVDGRFEWIIGENFMTTRKLNISEISENYSVRHAFKKFGRFVPKLMVKQSDIQWKNDEYSEIEEIARLVGKRCTNGNLKDLTITFDLPNVSTCQFRNNVPDFFKSLKSLTIIQGIPRSDGIDDCLVTLLAGCTGLKSLTLKKIQSNGKFLAVLNSIKLEKLSIDACAFTETNWLEFIEMGGIPSLKSLNWQKVNISGTAFCKDVFHHINIAFPNICKMSIESGQIPSVTCPSFAMFTNLKVLRAKCSWHNTDILKVLESMEHLEELYLEIHDRRERQYYRRYYYRGPQHIVYEAQTSDWKNAMKGLKGLRLIEVHSVNHRLSWDGIIELLVALPNVKEVHLKGIRPLLQKSIENVVSISPEMHTLSLKVPINSFKPKLYNTLVSGRSLWYRKSPVLNIFMDQQKVTEMKRQITGYATKANCISLQPFSM